MVLCQDVLSQRPKDVGRGRPQDVGRVRLLALQGEPYGEVPRTSFGAVFRTFSESDFAKWTLRDKDKLHRWSSFAAIRKNIYVRKGKCFPRTKNFKNFDANSMDTKR